MAAPYHASGIRPDAVRRPDDPDSGGRDVAALRVARRLLVASACRRSSTRFWWSCFARVPRSRSSWWGACAGIDVGGTVAEVGSADLSQVVSTEYRADVVAEIPHVTDVELAVRLPELAVLSAIAHSDVVE
jgi:hypothetical protein